MIAGGEEGITNNHAMVEHLQRTGKLWTRECIEAFRAVDRGLFWVEGSGAIAYAEMPLRYGRLHQSAPHIYARALEAFMPLRPGMSFLNIGAGTGYFSAVVSELLGDSESMIHGIDVWPETVTHAQERCARLGKHHLNFMEGNAYQLDVNIGMRYDRVYIGACASSRAKYLYELLEVGGILVGPFQSGNSQQLRRVVRESENCFKVEALNSVHFSSLVEPVADANQTTEGAEVLSRALVGLPGVPFTFALRQQPWTLERAWAYPASFRRVVTLALHGHSGDPGKLCLPPEIWMKHVLPWCGRWWFEQPPADPPPSRAMAALTFAGEVVKKALSSGEVVKKALSLRRGRTNSIDSLDSGSTRAESDRTHSMDSVASGSEVASSWSSPELPVHQERLHALEMDSEAHERSSLLTVLLEGGSDRQREAELWARLGEPTLRERNHRGAQGRWRCSSRCCQNMPRAGAVLRQRLSHHLLAARVFVSRVAVWRDV